MNTPPKFTRVKQVNIGDVLITDFRGTFYFSIPKEWTDLGISGMSEYINQNWGNFKKRPTANIIVYKVIDKADKGWITKELFKSYMKFKEDLVPY